MLTVLVAPRSVLKPVAALATCVQAVLSQASGVFEPSSTKRVGSLPESLLALVKSMRLIARGA